jgi:hypothetical protein
MTDALTWAGTYHLLATVIGQAAILVGVIGLIQTARDAKQA